MALYASLPHRAILLVILGHAVSCISSADVSIQIVHNPEPIVVPIDDLVSFDCTMRLKADKFEWLHLPEWPPSLAHATNIDSRHFSNRDNRTKLEFNVDSPSRAGGYQCVAWYGALAIASTPALLSIAEISEFQKVPSTTLYVTPGNTVSLQCPPPISNPPAQIQYDRTPPGNQILNVLPTPFGSLVLQNVTFRDNAEYTCRASNYISGTEVHAPFKTVLNVGSHKSKEAPKFLRPPPKNYTVLIDESITLECSAVGTPPPVMTWRRLDGVPTPRDRAEVTPVGLKLSNITRSDQGTYICEGSNGIMPSLMHHATLLVYERPVILSGPNAARVTEGDDLEFECIVKGVPEPSITWVINSRTVLNDTRIEAIGSKIYINPVEKRHAGTVQCFATNIVGTVYSIAFLTVVPKQISGMDMGGELDRRLSSAPPGPVPANNRARGRKPPHKKSKNRRKDKNSKMIPPSQPNITRLSDTSVMVRWNVPENDGMPIRFFKVQYREVSSSDQERNSRLKETKWSTLNEDIVSNVNTYEVDNLHEDSEYKFRIAAIYTNNDNKLGPNSARFHLQRGPFIGTNPLPTPVLVRTEAVNETAIKIYWELTNPAPAHIEGFYVYYRDLMNADDYIKETVDNATARSCLIAHLSPGKSYEIKLQSFTAGAGSDFSAILNQQTLAPVSEYPLNPEVVNAGPNIGADGAKPQIYVITSAAVGGIALLTGAILGLVVCKRYRRKKDQDVVSQGDVDCADKRNSNDGHHIQAESKDYAKSVGRRAMHNGCPPPGPKLTITPNPLAAATDEDKNQNVMEMSSFISQNNNCAGEGGAAGSSYTPSSGRSPDPAVTSSSSAPQTSSFNARNKKGKSAEIKTRMHQGSKSGENFV